jgi:hypothetical protein
MQAPASARLGDDQKQHKRTHSAHKKDSRNKQVCKRVVAPKVRLELTTYRLTAGRAADCAIQELHALL